MTHASTTTLDGHNLTVDGDTAIFYPVKDVVTVMAEGDFGSGGTLQLHVSPNKGTNWINAGNDAKLTADGLFNIQVPTGTACKMTLSGSTSPDLDVWAR